jgi:hypothetical protein
MAALLGTIAVQAAGAALPYAVDWVKKGIKTWGPAKIANNIVDSADKTGRSMMGGTGMLAAVGGAVGRGAGYLIAPFVVQSPPSQAMLELASAVTGAAVSALGNAVLNHFSGSSKTGKDNVQVNTPSKVETATTELEIEKMKIALRMKEIDLEMSKVQRNLNTGPAPVVDNEFHDWVLTSGAAAAAA